MVGALRDNQLSHRQHIPAKCWNNFWTLASDLTRDLCSHPPPLADACRGTNLEANAPSQQTWLIWTDPLFLSKPHWCQPRPQTASKSFKFCKHSFRESQHVYRSTQLGRRRQSDGSSRFNLKSNVYPCQSVGRREVWPNAYKLSTSPPQHLCCCWLIKRPQARMRDLFDAPWLSQIKQRSGSAEFVKTSNGPLGIANMSCRKIRFSAGEKNFRDSPSNFKKQPISLNLLIKPAVMLAPSLITYAI